MRQTGFLFEAQSGISRFLATAGEPIVVGRRPPFAPRNVRVQDRLISKEHFRVLVDDAGCTIEDAGSTGGTFVNGERAHGVAVVPGDRVSTSSHLVFTVSAFAGESVWDATMSVPLALAPALTMAHLIAHALARLHEAGGKHGALDPHEILLRDDGTATLTIPGWPVLDDGGRIQCNPIYVAPETLRDQRLEPAADVYAFGLVLHLALTGHALFSGDDPFEALQAKLTGPPPALPRDWPPELQSLVASMLDAEDRRVRAPELVTRLARLRGR